MSTCGQGSGLGNIAGDFSQKRTSRAGLPTGRALDGSVRLGMHGQGKGSWGDAWERGSWPGGPWSGEGRAGLTHLAVQPEEYEHDEEEAGPQLGQGHHRHRLRERDEGQTGACQAHTW